MKMYIYDIMLPKHPVSKGPLACLFSRNAADVNLYEKRLYLSLMGPLTSRDIVRH